MHRLLVSAALGLLLGLPLPAHAQEVAAAPKPPPAPDPRVTIRADIPYLQPEPADEYARSQCKLDVYLPKEAKAPFPLLVWFHGGALTGGSKSSHVSVKVAQSIAARGVGVVLVEYRLNPEVKFPVYIQDSAQGVRWAVENAASLGAQPKIFVGGHSAGGYLASILCMDPRYLAEAGVDPQFIGGYISMSGQLMTHYTIAEERGYSPKVITADDAAPIHYIRKDMPPLLLLVGDKDWPARLEENQFFYAALKLVAEGDKVSLFVIKDRTHGGILSNSANDDDPAAQLILSFAGSGVLPPDGSAPVQVPDKASLVDPTAQP